MNTSSSQAFPSARHGIAPLLAAVASITSVGIGISLLTPLLSLVLEARGVSDSLIGLNTMAGAIGALVSTFYTTRLARYAGVARMMVLTPIATASLILLLYNLPDYVIWLPLRFAVFFGLTIHFILSEFWIVSKAPSDRRGLWMAIYATSLSVGFAIGTLVLSLIGSAGVWPFIACAGLVLLAAVPPLVMQDHAPKLNRDETASTLRYIFIVPLAIFASAVFAASESSVMAMMPLYGLNTGYGEADANLLLLSVMLGGAVFQLPIGLLSDRVNRRVLLTLISAVGVAGMVVLPFVITSFWIAAPILLAWGGITAGLYTVGLAHLGSRLDGNALAGANSAFVLAYSIGMIIGPPVAGLALDGDPVYGFPILLALPFLLYFIYALYRLCRSSPDAAS